MVAQTLPLELPPGFVLSDATEGVIGAGKIPVLAPVPASPSDFRTSSLISSNVGIGVDEAYSKDEQQLNEFLKLHPMLSMLVYAYGSNSNLPRARCQISQSIHHRWNFALVALLLSQGSHQPPHATAGVEHV